MSGQPLVVVGPDGKSSVPEVRVDEAERLLAPAEQQRLQRMRRPEDRAAFAVAHATLRLVLAERLGSSPELIQLGRTREGRPVVRDAPGLHLSLSRRPAVVAVAVCDVPVGVDVDVAYPSLPWRELSRRFLSPLDLARIAENSDPAGTFMQLWVRKEALVKASGLPLEGALAVPTDWEEGQESRVEVIDSLARSVGVRILDMDLPSGIFGSGALVEGAVF